ncbi:hypothetical protein Acr_25g0003270 [Actinidia rufa]|uniref:Uncharacterized protein n=1 Tax=Actinidia rufa TaxID=165716 RepID=A0A7J0GYV1_9ERIC|nr:hypothetical protein Acr_25g0003270 [Actinidia rufa]
MVHTKHASNDPRAGLNLEEPETVSNQRWFKTMAIQDAWVPNFRERPIITDNQPTIVLIKGFSNSTVKKGKNLGLIEQEREEERVDNMDVKGNLDIIPLQTERVQIPPNAQEQEQDVGYDTEHVNEEIHVGVNVETKSPMHRASPIHEGTSYKEGPPTWFLRYFNELKTSLEEVKQQQEEIIQNQVRQEQYMDRLGDSLHGLDQQVDRLGTFYEEQGQRVDRIGNMCETMHEENSQHFPTSTVIWKVYGMYLVHILLLHLLHRVKDLLGLLPIAIRLIDDAPKR